MGTNPIPLHRNQVHNRTQLLDASQDNRQPKQHHLKPTAHVLPPQHDPEQPTRSSDRHSLPHNANPDNAQPVPTIDPSPHRRRKHNRRAAPRQRVNRHLEKRTREQRRDEEHRPELEQPRVPRREEVRDVETSRYGSRSISPHRTR